MLPLELADPPFLVVVDVARYDSLLQHLDLLRRFHILRGYVDVSLSQDVSNHQHVVRCFVQLRGAVCYLTDLGPDVFLGLSVGELSVVDKGLLAAFHAQQIHKTVADVHSLGQRVQELLCLQAASVDLALQFTNHAFDLLFDETPIGHPRPQLPYFVLKRLNLLLVSFIALSDCRHILLQTQGNILIALDLELILLQLPLHVVNLPFRLNSLGTYLHLLVD